MKMQKLYTAPEILIWRPANVNLQCYNLSSYNNTSLNSIMLCTYTYINQPFSVNYPHLKVGAS